MMNEKQDGEFASHFEAFRRMLLHSVISVMVIFPVGVMVAPRFLDFVIMKSLHGSLGKLHYFSPLEAFSIQIKTGLLLAFAMAFPYIVYEVKKFVSPALHKNERMFWGALIFSSVLLFIAGGGFCLYAVLPLVMRFSTGFETAQIQATFGLSHFISLAAGLVCGFGVVFQLPLAIILGVRLNLIGIGFLKNIRPYVLVVILIVSAVLTPPDVVSQLMLAIPGYLLYESGILIAGILAKREREKSNFMKEELS